MTSWTTNDEAIGSWLDEHGTGAWEGCPTVKRTMLKGGTRESNRKWMQEHLMALYEIGFPLERVTEIGAGTGQFAWEYLEKYRDGSLPCEYRIVDLPNVSRIQKDVLVGMQVEWTDAVAMDDGLIVNLFALSEMPFGKRWSMLNDIGLGNAMFFAFQARHEGMENTQWFLDFAMDLRRPFTVSPVDHEGCWYMYIEEGE